MNDTAKVVLTLLGSVLFCAAVVATVQSLLTSGDGNSAAFGGVVIGLGLAFLIIPWLPDTPSARRDSAEEQPPRRINAA